MRMDIALIWQAVHKFSRIDLLSIKINVDNFEEALEFFLNRGFVNSRGDKVTVTSSSKDTFLISPSGFGITLCEHLK